MPAKKRQPVAKNRKKAGNTVEHRVATPRGDLFVLRLGKVKAIASSRQPEKSDVLVDNLMKAALKPGFRRDTVFSFKKRVYAYSVYPEDVSKIVREDANGKKTLGRLVQGRFRPSRAKSM
ncbi:MAG: hypothetical protein WAK33_10840 [Silvibacterium sp.]